MEEPFDYPASKVAAAVVFKDVLYVFTEAGGVYAKQNPGDPWTISSLPIPQSGGCLPAPPSSAKPF